MQPGGSPECVTSIYSIHFDSIIMDRKLILRFSSPFSFNRAEKLSGDEEKAIKTRAPEREIENQADRRRRRMLTNKFFFVIPSICILFQSYLFLNVEPKRKMMQKKKS